jgi:serine protease AprX
MGSGRRRRSLSAVLVAAACLAAVVPGRSPVKASYSAPTDPELVQQLGDPLKTVGAFVHFTRTTPFLDGVERVTSNGLKVGARLPAANAVYATGISAALNRIRSDVHIARLEFAKPIPLTLETATWTTRARSLWQPTGGLDLRVPAPSGGPIDGAGVGIGIIDSGIDASHPDLDWCGNGPAGDCKTVLNFKVACADQFAFISDDCSSGLVMRDVEDSDTTAGHGTHVSGIAAGTGETSNGLYSGVAPGAKLYGFGTGDGDRILAQNAAMSFQWIIDHHADPLGNGMAPVAGSPADPPIEVINNSYGAPSDYSPDDVLSKMAQAAIGEGITVVWAAGNSGGTGGRDCTDVLGNPVPCTEGSASDPTPGIISAANYDDDDSANRDNVLSSDSSRGIEADPATWPDISAPGSLIMSTCKPLTLFCPLGPDLTYPPYYGNLSGTSMAAPHTAGIVALLNQARPGITPAEVEDVLQDTAHKFTAGAAYVADPQNPGGTSSFDKGAGLADTRSAVLRVLGLPDDFGYGAGGPQVTISAPQDGATTPARLTATGSAASRTPGGQAPTARVLADETTVLDHVVGSVDFQTLQLSEPAAGLLEVRYTVKDTSLPPPVAHSYDLFYALGTSTGRLSLSWEPSTGEMSCDQVVNDGTTNSSIPLPGCVGAHPDPTTFTLTFPVDEILPDGVELRGAVLRDMWAASYIGVIQDQLPGGIGSSVIHPERADPYVLSGGTTPGTDEPGTVSLSLDGGDPEPVASGVGTIPWTHEFGPLADGPHTLTAQLVSGSTTVTDSVDFAVQGSSVDISSPADGGVVPATAFTVSGTTDSDPSIAAAAVTIRATAPGFDSGPIAAAGGPGGRFETWSAPLDLSGAAGSTVSVVASLVVEGGKTYTDTVSLATSCWPPRTFADDLEPAPASGWTFDVARQDDPASTTWAHATDASAKSATHSFFTDGESGDPIAGGIQSGVKDDRLVAQSQRVSSVTRLEFWHRYNLEATFDGGRIEVSTDGGGTWRTLDEAGVSLLEGGYNDDVPDPTSTTDRDDAWSGSSGAGMTRVVADVGALGGSDVLVRFRFTADAGAFPTGAGWWVDDVTFTQLLDPAPCPAAPDTTITDGPSGTILTKSATFSFDSDQAGARFECSLDGAVFTRCASPLKLTKLAKGQRTFRVRALTTKTDATPDERTFRVKL